jgi:heme-degrading monooxygenase HmoA
VIGEDAMMARMWRGRTPASKADIYLEYLRETGLKEYAAIPGNEGVLVLRRVSEEQAEFLLISLWESEEAIRRFAGEDFERAVYYAEDDEYLLEREPGVVHYDVVEASM